MIEMTWTSQHFNGRWEELEDFYQSNLNKMETEYDLGRGLLLRFLRGMIAGAVSSGLMISFVGNTFDDLKSFLATLVVALISGAISGALLAVDKFLRV